MDAVYGFEQKQKNRNVKQNYDLALVGAISIMWLDALWRHVWVGGGGGGGGDITVWQHTESKQRVSCHIQTPMEYNWNISKSAVIPTRHTAETAQRDFQ